MILVLGFGAQVLAVDEPENVIKYRQSVLKAAKITCSNPCTL